jgi:hypothetical protein
MEAETYDGIPIPELPIQAVDWEHRGEYIRTRSKRKGPDEFDVEPEWATEAVMDSRVVIRLDRASRSGESVRVTGYSAAAGRVLVVILIPKEHPPTGSWWGVNAWSANDRDRAEYADDEETP